MTTHSTRALEFFTGGYNCAQSVIMAYAEEYSVSLHHAAKLAAGFGGGIGRKQYTCGAVTGGVMVLGSMLFDEKAPEESKKQVYDKVRVFMDSFEKTHTCSDCKGLLGVDLSTPEGVDKAKQNNLSRLVCDALITDVCQMLDAVIEGSKP